VLLVREVVPWWYQLWESSSRKQLIFDLNIRINVSRKFNYIFVVFSGKMSFYM
jgi:hypothetical protein